MVNGKKVAILNERVPRRVKSGDVHKVVLRLNRKMLREGVNELVILGGVSGGNIADFELHRIVVDQRRLQER
jgi:hypothetical protein